jgi:hypothetical protein
VSAPNRSRKVVRVFSAPRVKKPEAAAEPRVAAVDDIEVQCLHCRHVGRLTGPDLSRRGISPGSPIVSFVKRLRCRKCGSHSVRAKRIGQRKAG